MNVVNLGVSAGPDVSVVMLTTLVSLLGVATLMLLAWVAIAAPRAATAQTGAGAGGGKLLRPVLVTLLPCDVQRRLVGVRQPHPWELPGSSYGPTRAPPLPTASLSSAPAQFNHFVLPPASIGQAPCCAPTQQT